MAYASVNGANLYYEISGSGPTVVQIGGAVNGHEGYALITPQMQPHFTVIDYDHRGYGQSDRPSQRYTMETWADDLAGLLDQLGIERCHVHGGSMGGFIACLFAAKYPERVDRLRLQRCGGKVRLDGANQLLPLEARGPDIWPGFR